MTKPIRIVSTTLFVLIAVFTLIANCPLLAGRIEAVTNRDLLGIGRCRIDNPQAVIGSGDRAARIVVGTVQRRNGTGCVHIWGVTGDGKIVDHSCSPTNPDCQQRNEIAVFDPWRKDIPVVSKQATTKKQIQTVAWSREYLRSFLYGGRS